MGGTINLAMVHFYTNSLSSKKFLLCSMKMKHKADRKSFSYPKIDIRIMMTLRRATGVSMFSRAFFSLSKR